MWHEPRVDGLKVFISSVVTGFEPFRDAAAQAVRALGHEVRRSEDFGASTASPQRVCLDGVRWGEVVIVLLGARYGDVQASGLSATHEEYREARETTDVLAFIQTRRDKEPRQDAFVAEVRDWAGGHIAPSFDTPEELRDAVVRGLHDHELRIAALAADEGEMLARAVEGLQSGQGYRGPEVTVVVAGGPKQQIIRPAEIADPELARSLTQLAMFGANAVLDPQEGARPQATGGTLLLQSQTTALAIDQLGTIRVTHPATQPGGSAHLPAVLEEDLVEDLGRDLRFAGEILDRLEGRGRISSVVPVVGLVLGGAGFRTRAEHAASPNSMEMPRNMGPVSVHLTPASRRRAALLHDTGGMVADIVALLRDEVNH
jgi:hypothetical protein